MARVKKIDNAILKRRAQQIEKERRKYAFRLQRERILIVTEGERTEPNYFEGILCHPYQKNDPNIFFELQSKGNQSQAINWAKNLLAKFDQTNPAQEKPTTTVFKLVEELNKFIST